jgi:hypothetical protein
LTASHLYVAVAHLPTFLRNECVETTGMTPACTKNRQVLAMQF